MIRLDITISQAVQIYDGLELLKYEYSKMAADTPSDRMSDMYDDMREEIEALQNYIFKDRGARCYD
jgi:hypothetical protein